MFTEQRKITEETIANNGKITNQQVIFEKFYKKINSLIFLELRINAAKEQRET